MPHYADPRVRGATAIGILAGLLLALGIAFAIWTGVCPCERMPGAYLLGDEVTEPVEDWTFANQVPLCQIQVSTALLPHSINLNCMASEGELFLSCASCDGKYWSTAVLASSAARLRLGERVYPVTVSRVTDDATLDRAWAARAAKIGRGADQPRQDGWWSFRVASR
jgi:hypothetical protein